MTYTQLLKKYWYIVVVIVVLITVASFAVSVIQKPEYKSTVRLLVIQKQAGQLDAYTAARSAETVAGILSKMIYTSTFFDQVMSAGFNVNKDSFSSNPEERKKDWKKAVDTQVIEDSGTIQVGIYDENRHQAEQLAYAVAYVMIDKGQEYHGGETQIEIKMVDAPITSEKPVRPSIIRNTGAGFILGLLASLSLIFLLSERIGRSKLDKELEVTTMPKAKEIKEWKEQNTINRKPFKNKKKKAKPVNKKPKPDKAVAEKKFVPTQPVQTTDSNQNEVKQRFSAGFSKIKETVRDIPYNLPPQPKTQSETTTPPSIGASQRNVKGKLSEGVKKIGAPREKAELAPGEVVYQLDNSDDDQDEEEKLPAGDKYSQDRIEKWIQTGKFE